MVIGFAVATTSATWWVASWLWFVIGFKLWGVVFICIV